MKNKKSSRTGLFCLTNAQLFPTNRVKRNFWSKHFGFSSTIFFLSAFAFLPWFTFCFTAKSKQKSTAATKKSLTNLQIRHKMDEAIEEVLEDLASSVDTNESCSERSVQNISGHEESAANTVIWDSPKTQKSAAGGLFVHTNKQLCVNIQHTRIHLIQAF